MEAEQNKNRKEAQAFAKFFVAKKVENKSEPNEHGEQLNCDQMPSTFMSFQVKDDMKIAPIIRRTLNSDERSSFEHLLSSDIPKDDLYLSQLKRNIFSPRNYPRTWPDDEDEKVSNDDLFVIGKNIFFFSTFWFIDWVNKLKYILIWIKREWSKCATAWRGTEKTLPSKIFQIRGKSTTTILRYMA